MLFLYAYVNFIDGVVWGTPVTCPVPQILQQLMDDSFEKILGLLKDLRIFFGELTAYLIDHFHLSFIRFEAGKSAFVTSLYRQRGKLSRRLMHSGMATLAALGVVIAPSIAQEIPGRSYNPWEISSPSSVLSAATQNPEIQTLVSDKVRDKIVEYKVESGDTVSSIAQKFGVSEETILWQNNLTKKSKITVGQTLGVLPVSGIAHKVNKGDTVYSIAKKYDVDAQDVVNFPFNAFQNDESFRLAIGDLIIVPDGQMPEPTVTSPRPKFLTPDAGSVAASGQFVWPAGGTLTSRYAWWHPGLDIANSSGPNILAADSGRVVVAGWVDNTGYGNRIMIDHGNGFVTLYAHLSQVYVQVGQTVSKGSVIGKMGSTGRSTGTHLHFEIRKGASRFNPLNYLSK